MLSMLLLIALLPSYTSAMQTKADKQGLTFVFTNKKSSKSILLKTEHLNALPGLKAFYKDSQQHTIENPKHITYEHLALTKNIATALNCLKNPSKNLTDSVAKNILLNEPSFDIPNYINFLDEWNGKNTLLSNAILLGVYKKIDLSTVNSNLQERIKNLSLLMENNVFHLHVKKLPLKYSDLYENTVEDFIGTKNTNQLTRLSAANEGFSHEVLEENSNKITNFPSHTKFAKLETILLTEAHIGYLPAATWKNLKELDLSESCIAEINPNFNAPVLEKLWLNNCNVLKKNSNYFP